MRRKIVWGTITPQVYEKVLEKLKEERKKNLFMTKSKIVEMLIERGLEK